MTDTQIIDFLEKSLLERHGDERYIAHYLCMIGKVHLIMGKDQRTFRERVEEAFDKAVTDRLTK